VTVIAVRRKRGEISYIYGTKVRYEPEVHNLTPAGGKRKKGWTGIEYRRNNTLLRDRIRNYSEGGEKGQPGKQRKRFYKILKSATQRWNTSSSGTLFELKGNFRWATDLSEEGRTWQNLPEKKKKKRHARKESGHQKRESSGIVLNPIKKGLRILSKTNDWVEIRKNFRQTKICERGRGPSELAQKKNSRTVSLTNIRRGKNARVVHVRKKSPKRRLYPEKPAELPARKALDP